MDGKSTPGDRSEIQLKKNEPIYDLQIQKMKNDKQTVQLNTIEQFQDEEKVREAIVNKIMNEKKNTSAITFDGAFTNSNTTKKKIDLYQ